MKFTDIINEGRSIEMYFTPEQKKEEKKAKTVLKVFKKGTIKVRHPRKDDEFIVFRYVINDDVSYRWEVATGKEYVIIITDFRDGITIHMDDEFAFKYLTQKNDRVLNDHLKYMITSKIKGKFESFDVNIHVREEGMNFVLDKPEEPLNEAMRYKTSDLTEKDIKKADLIYKLHKTGKYKIDNMTYKYVLPDDYWVTIDEESGNPVIVLSSATDPASKLNLHMVLTKNNGELYYPKVDKEYSQLFNDARYRIKQKFDSFNLDIVF